jgi:cytochrome c biogenesis protein
MDAQTLVAGMEAGSIGRRALVQLASLRLTLAVIVLLAAGVIAAYFLHGATTWPVAIPLLLFAINLGAAVAVHPAFRRQAALLVFHLALIAIVLLVAAGRLTYLKGRLELAQGEAFAGRLTQAEQGPLHFGRLERAGFVNDGFSIHYAAGLRRGATRNHVSWTDAGGMMRSAVIGDNDPLLRAGYRFYTSFNKGFAPTFLWQPRGGRPEIGAVHLPAYPLHEYRQAQEWQPPGSATSLWIMLMFDEVVLDIGKATEFRLPETHSLVVRLNDVRHELQPGDALRLPDGVLTYQGLRSWMGYTVFHDFTLPWLLAACALAVASLGWHFWSKFSARPWDR